MSPKTTTGRKALDRLLIVAAVAAVLVSVGAWIALNRPGGAAEAAGASSSLGSSGGSFSETSGVAASGSAGSGDQAAAAAEPSTSAAAGSTAAAGGSGTGSRTGTGTAATTAGPTSSATSNLSPTTAFLNALAASGLAPPVDDAQKLAMADDVCQELKNGSTYTDMVRALTFAGATDEQAANFARLSITNLCPQFPVG